MSIDLQRLITHNLAESHGKFDFYYKKEIDKIVLDAPNEKLVAVFKDYLIYDDCSCEFL